MAKKTASASKTETAASLEGRGLLARLTMKGYRLDLREGRSHELVCRLSSDSGTPMSLSYCGIADRDVPAFWCPGAELGQIEAIESLAGRRDVGVRVAISPVLKGGA